MRNFLLLAQLLLSWRTALATEPVICNSLSNAAEIEHSEDFVTPKNGIQEIKRARSFKGDFADHIRDIGQGPGSIAIGFDAGNKVLAVNVANGKELWSTQYFPQGKQSSAHMTDMKFSPDGKSFVVVGGGFFDIYPADSGAVGTRGHNGPKPTRSFLNRENTKEGEEIFYNSKYQFRAHWFEDGQRILVAATPSPHSGGRGTKLMVWNTLSGLREREIKLDETILNDPTSMKVSADGERLFTLTRTGAAIVNLKNGEVISKYDISTASKVSSGAFTTDGQLAAIAVSSPKRGIAYISTTTGKLIDFFATDILPSKISFNDNATKIYAFGSKQVLVYNLLSKKLEKHYAIRSNKPVQNVMITDYYSGASSFSAAFSKDMKFLLVEEMESVATPDIFKDQIKDDGFGGKILFTIGAGSYRISAYPLD